MQYEFDGVQAKALTAGDVRVHLGRAADDTTSLPDSQVDGWIAEAHQDCYAQTGYFPAATAVKIRWDRFPCRRRHLRILGGLISGSPAVTYRTEADPDNASTLPTTQYHVINRHPLGEIWLRDGLSWPTATLIPAAGVELTATVGAPGNVAQILRRAMLLKIGSWAANRAEEEEPLVPGAQVQKMVETAARIYQQQSILGSFLENEDSIGDRRGRREVA